MSKSLKNTKETVFYVKNMVGNSCIRLIQSELGQNDGVSIDKVELGKVEVSYDPTIISVDQIETVLEKSGFPPVNDEEMKLVEQIKVAAIELIYHANNANSLIRNSDYLSEKLGMPYFHLSKLFSEKTNTTLEKYIILLKIEKVKELISYDEYTLSEISYMMNYSSVQYLSNQFKQITGYSVSEYKRLPEKQRVPLEALLQYA